MESNFTNEENDFSYHKVPMTFGRDVITSLLYLKTTVNKNCPSDRSAAPEQFIIQTDKIATLNYYR